MSWMTVALVVVVWWAASVPLAIVVGRLLRRSGSAYPVDPSATSRPAGPVPQLGNTAALSA